MTRPCAHSRRVPLVVIVLAFALGACATAGAPDSTDASSPPPADVSPAQSEPSTGSSDAGATAPATIATADSDEYGPLLVDGEGMTLYVFLQDAEGRSGCFEACADNWPPVLTGGETTADGDVDDHLIGTTERGGGVEQVTYDGRPLYRFSGDSDPGDVRGFGSGDVWYPVAPDGTAIDIAEDRGDDTAGGGY